MKLGKAIRQSIISAVLLQASLACAVSYPPPQPPKQSDETVIAVESARVHELLGSNPAIPRSWKLISVSGGEKSNSSNLWFQAEDGSVYLLQGFTSQNRFIFHEQVYKIPAK